MRSEVVHLRPDTFVVAAASFGTKYLTIYPPVHTHSHIDKKKYIHQHTLAHGHTHTRPVMGTQRALLTTRIGD